MLTASEVLSSRDYWQGLTASKSSWLRQDGYGQNRHGQLLFASIFIDEEEARLMHRTRTDARLPCTAALPRAEE